MKLTIENENGTSYLIELHALERKICVQKIDLAPEAVPPVARTELPTNGNGHAVTAAVTADVFSNREKSILRALSRGASNKEIARTIVVTESTVKVHMKSVLRKLRVNNRTAAALWARENIT